MKTKEEYNEYMRVYMSKRYERRRSDFIVSRGGKCGLCGSIEQLEIDHKNREVKSFDLGKALAGWAEARIQEELAKCQVLCHLCHKKKTQSEMTVGHGGGATGMRNCYCTLCKPLKSTYNRKRRSKQKQCLCGELIDTRSKTCRKCNMKQLNNRIP